eukprot:TRINITY_DN17632_c0_g1_i1.p1 TRINITY_DN17632_c0_g1~~TRINITY_DN17632_c0_g1_i1.p1  ORF type:complete len:612 (-),score=72.61 TRINITY_DN17632_c0_g1_i1:77-1912(-)
MPSTKRPLFCTKCCRIQCVFPALVCFGLLHLMSPRHGKLCGDQGHAWGMAALCGDVVEPASAEMVTNASDLASDPSAPDTSPDDLPYPASKIEVQVDEFETGSVNFQGLAVASGEGDSSAEASVVDTLDEEAVVDAVTSTTTSKPMKGSVHVTRVSGSKKAARKAAGLPDKKSTTKPPDASTSSESRPDGEAPVSDAEKAVLKNASLDFERLAASWAHANAPPGCARTGPAPPTCSRRRKSSSKCDICGGRIHFLFMAGDQLYHTKLWRRFFDDAPEGSYTIFVHCVKPAHCKHSGTIEDFPQNTVFVETVKTIRCWDLVSAEAHLVKEALSRYPKVPGLREKFVLVSDTTLPVKPFSTVYAALMAQRESGFCFGSVHSWVPKSFRWDFDLRRPVPGGKSRSSLLVKHSQFFVLNREDAQWFADKWKGITRMKNKWPSWRIPLLNQRWTNVRGGFVEARIFAESPHANLGGGLCADEFAVFSTIYGVFDPGPGGDLRDWSRRAACPLNRSIKCKQPSDILRHSRCYTLSVAYSKNPVVQAIQKLPTSKMKPGMGGHGLEFKVLDQRALRVLRAAPYLFVRKFHSNCSLDGFERIVLSAPDEPADANSRSDA